MHTVEYLLAIIAGIVGISLFAFMGVSYDPNASGWNGAFLQVLPELIGACLVYTVLYFAFTRKGVFDAHLTKTDLRNEIEQRWSWVDENAFKGTRADLAAIRQDLLALRSEFSATKDRQIDALSLNTTIDKIGRDLDVAVKSILHEVKQQQIAFADSVQDRFKELSKESAVRLETTLRNELNAAGYGDRSDKDRIIGRFGEVMFHALNSMGQYQRESMERKAIESLESIEKEFRTAVVDIKEGVTQLRTKVDDLVLALPPAPVAEAKVQLKEGGDPA